MKNGIKGLSTRLIIVVIASSLLFVSGCGSSTNTPQSGAANVKKGEFVIKLACPAPPEDASTMAYFKFKDLVESRTNGRITVQVFPNGQLGDTVSNISQIQAGNL